MERQLALIKQQELGISVIRIIREEYEMILLNRLFDSPLGGRVVFRGGRALRLAYNSPRFSDDLDFSKIQEITQKEFQTWCEQTAKATPYMELDETLQKYYTLYAMFKVKDLTLPATVSIKIEISVRKEQWEQDKDYKLMRLRNEVTPVTVLAQVASLERIEQEKRRISPARVRDVFDLWFIGQVLKKDYSMDFSRFTAKEVKRDLHRQLAEGKRRMIEQWLPKE